MGKGGGSITIGYRYYMTIHMGLCRGPIDEVVQINVGDVRAWPVPEGEAFKYGTFSAENVMCVAKGPDPDLGVVIKEDGSSYQISSQFINTIDRSEEVKINAPELFGGDSKEGGIEGQLQMLMGAERQIVPQWIKNLMGGRVPEFRGVATMVYNGLLTSLNPYPKSWEVRVRRTESGWDGPVWQPALATIWMANGTIKAMNGAHIIYECLTNRDWGRGYAREWMNEDAFLEVAQTLYDEGFGLCLRWNRQGSIGEFVQQVIDHIGGSLYVDRSNGLITPSLLRGNYDPEDLPLFTYDSGLLTVENSEVTSQEDVVNEVIAPWKDPIRKEERQARAQNLASLQTLGGVNSVTTDYSGIPEVNLALRVAQRDLKANATSLRRFTVKLDRRAWKIVPGALFRISAPDKDIYNVVLRAGKIEDGGAKNGTITVTAVLDVFGLPASSFVASEATQWQPPDRKPVIPSFRYLREATYADLVRNIGPADLQTVTNDVGTIATFVGKPAPLNQGYQIASGANGEDVLVREAGAFVPVAETSNAVTKAQGSIAFEGGVDMGLISDDIAVQLGDEICRLESITMDENSTTSGIMVVARGCVDTIPQDHDAGTQIFFLNTNRGSDNREYMVGEEVDVQILTTSSSSVLSQDLAPIDEITIAARQARPWAPGDVRVNGEPYLTASPVAGTIEIRWGHRNRKVIQDQLVAHSDPGTTAEPGTTYEVRAYDNLGNLLRTWSGIAGTGIDYTAAMASADGYAGNVTFELEAKRDGLTSHSTVRFTVNRS